MIHGYWLKQYGIDGSYERIDVAPAAFESFMRGFAARDFRGGNVTLPHKEAALRLADQPTERARRVGAANTLWLENGRIHADNTDVLGFLASLDQALGAGWSARTALVLGAGGAARGIVAGLLDRGVSTIRVANRTPAKAEELAKLEPLRVHPLAWESPWPLQDVDILVNTTSLGMSGEPVLEIDLEGLPDHAVVADIVYVPLETPLLVQARARGLRVVDGLDMLLHQAVPGFAHWFGVTPQVTPELRALVQADLTRS